MLSAITRLFPLWALLLSVLAYYTPTHFTGIGPWVTTLLMLIMLGMGVHLKIDDFKRVLSRPAPVAAGIFLHYLVMPLAAWLLAMAFKMPPDLSAGMVLVGSVASGYLTRLYVRWFGCTRVNSVIASSVTGAFLMLSLALVAITRDPYITIILISIGGFGHQIISCMLSALVVESFDKGQMATVNGMRGSAAWIASFLFSLLIGVTADKIGFNPLFIAMGFFDLIGAVFLVAFIAERRAKRA